MTGPLLDCFDIHIEVPRVEYEKLSDRRLGETSAAIQQRVEAARQIQRKRFKCNSVERSSPEIAVTCNADMRPAEVRQFCQLDETSRNLMQSHMCFLR